VKEDNKFSSFICKNLNMVLGFLIVILILNYISDIVQISLHHSFLSVSSFFSILFAIYVLSNVTGAKFGRRFNMHIFRWLWLKKHDRESEYEDICIKYICILFPISCCWTLINVGFAIYNLIQ
jgi:hypothetical protein